RRGVPVSLGSMRVLPWHRCACTRNRSCEYSHHATHPVNHSVACEIFHRYHRWASAGLGPTVSDRGSPNPDQGGYAYSIPVDPWQRSGDPVPDTNGSAAEFGRLYRLRLRG